ncbi:MAG TPA: hypothetical protein VF904_16130 [Anaeromyxobacteraceae bacterium]
MTDAERAHEAEHAHGHPPAEEDIIPSGKIVWVGVVALVIFTLGSIATGIGMRAMRREANPDGPPAQPAEAGRAKIAMIEQRLFEHANQGVAWREHAHRRLQSTGWVDRSKGVVHIPIDRAMELVEKGARP